MDIPSAIECVCEEGHRHAPRVPDAPEPAPEPGTIPVTRIEDLRPGDWARVRLETEDHEAFLEGVVWTKADGRPLRLGFIAVRLDVVTLVSAHRPDPLAGVELVMDYDGDLWRRTGPDEWAWGGNMRRGGSMRRATRDVLSAHGPVTPLHPGEEVSA